MPEMNEIRKQRTDQTEKLGKAIMQLIIADDRIGNAHPEAVGNALAALASNMACVLAGVVMCQGDDTAREVLECTIQMVNDGVSTIVGRPLRSLRRSKRRSTNPDAATPASPVR